MEVTCLRMTASWNEPSPLEEDTAERGTVPEIIHATEFYWLTFGGKFWGKKWIRIL
jgi:hypothetical protein